MLSPLPISGGEESMKGGAKRRGVPVKTLKKLLKKAGLKTSGKKATLTRRAKKARLMKGGGDNGEMMADTTQINKVKTAEEEAADAEEEAKRKEEEAKKAEMGGRKRRKSRGLKLF